MCPICHSDDIKKIVIDKKFVTSDIKVIEYKPTICECKKCSHIFKKQEKNLLETINQNYYDYELYKISNGTSEYYNYDTIKTKNSIIIEFTINQINERNKNKIKWLDYGCGNGKLIDEVNQISNYKYLIKGYDKYSKLNREDILTDLNIISNERYDVITLVHVLEHIVEPTKLIQSLINKLEFGGIIIINIPDIYNNPYDLFVIDHLHHFNKYSLYYLLNNIENIKINSYNLIENQILLVIQKNKILKNTLNKLNQLNNKVEDIIKFIDGKIQKINNLNESYYLFGTSIAAQFLTQNSVGKIIAYVDENNNKIGKKFNNIEVIGISNSYKNRVLCFPLGNEFGKSIYDKLKINYKNII